jgi:DNA-binding CsgD family transcriptional regulator
LTERSKAAILFKRLKSSLRVFEEKGHTMQHSYRAHTAPTKPLSSAHHSLLEACLRLHTDDTQKLARFLHLAPVTVKKYFSRIFQILDKSTRAEVILWYASQQGLLLPAVTLSPASTGKKAGKVEYCLPKKTTQTNQITLLMVYRTLVGAKEGNTPNASVQQGKELLLNVDEEERRIFIDQVAQAVIDRMEQRDQILGIVDLVTQKVIEQQRQSAALQAAAEAEQAENNSPTTEPGNEEAA